MNSKVINLVDRRLSNAKTEQAEYALKLLDGVMEAAIEMQRQIILSNMRIGTANLQAVLMCAKQLIIAMEPKK